MTELHKAERLYGGPNWPEYASAFCAWDPGAGDDDVGSQYLWRRRREDFSGFAKAIVGHAETQVEAAAAAAAVLLSEPGRYWREPQTALWSVLKNGLAAPHVETDADVLEHCTGLWAQEFARAANPDIPREWQRYHDAVRNMLGELLRTTIEDTIGDVRHMMDWRIKSGHLTMLSPWPEKEAGDYHMAIYAAGLAIATALVSGCRCGKHQQACHADAKKSHGCCKLNHSILSWAPAREPLRDFLRRAVRGRRGPALKMEDFRNEGMILCDPASGEGDLLNDYFVESGGPIVVGPVEFTVCLNDDEQCRGHAPEGIHGRDLEGRQLYEGPPATPCPRCGSTHSAVQTQNPEVRHIYRVNRKSWLLVPGGIDAATSYYVVERRACQSANCQNMVPTYDASEQCFFCNGKLTPFQTTLSGTQSGVYKRCEACNVPHVPTHLCAVCGGRLTTKDKVVTCESCGASRAPDYPLDALCPRCGSGLSAKGTTMWVRGAPYTGQIAAQIPDVEEFGDDTDE